MLIPITSRRDGARPIQAVEERRDPRLEEALGGDNAGDASMMSVSSCCFSEDIMHESILHKAN